MAKPHVFGIGLMRTGTRSLCRALEILGWKTAHCTVAGGGLITPDRLDDQHYEAAADITVAGRFEEFDRRYRPRLFVLTLRERWHWIKSIARLYLHNAPGLARARVPGDPLAEVFAAAYGGLPPERFDSSWWFGAYDRHERRVTRHFARHPRCLLRMDICRGEGWQALCKFLRVPMPDRPFPHESDASDRAL